MNERVLIFGAGNWMYGDDAAGIMIANELGRRLGNLAQVSYDLRRARQLCSETRGRGPELAVIITVVEQSADVPAGSWSRYEFPDAKGNKAPTLGNSGNSPAPSVIELGRHLGSLASRVWVYALARRDFQLGAPLSYPVKEALEPLESLVEADIRTALGMETLRSTQSLGQENTMSQEGVLN